MTKKDTYLNGYEREWLADAASHSDRSMPAFISRLIDLDIPPLTDTAIALTDYYTNRNATPDTPADYRRFIHEWQLYFVCQYCYDKIEVAYLS